MQFAKLAAVLVLAGSAAAGTSVHAKPIGPSGFNGSETVVTFDDLLPFWGPSYLSLQGVTLSAASDWSIQHPYTGAILGTSGAALNETSGTDHDFTLWFDAPIERFGINYGIGEGFGTASATATAYDAAGKVIETLTRTDFENTFFGFAFNAGVSKIVFDRFDTNGMYTFLDDVRFVNGDGSGNAGGEVPEPASLALLALGAAGAALSRRRARS